MYSIKIRYFFKVIVASTLRYKHTKCTKSLNVQALLENMPGAECNLLSKKGVKIKFYSETQNTTVNSKARLPGTSKFFNYHNLSCNFRDLSILTETFANHLENFMTYYSSQRISFSFSFVCFSTAINSFFKTLNMLR
jgi:ethanolamine utilization cobalamin adenosyltransferase